MPGRGYRFAEKEHIVPASKLEIPTAPLTLPLAATENARNTPFHYDPMPTLRADKVPQRWILGGEDYLAPSAETRRRIKSLIGSGLPFTLAYYQHAEHGMTLFETQADGTRPVTSP